MTRSGTPFQQNRRHGDQRRDNVTPPRDSAAFRNLPAKNRILTSRVATPDSLPEI
jgi:hypothetical protein